MKKHIIFGGFDYAVYYEMDSDAILCGIDYFVDNDPKLIGTTYLGKPIKSPDALLAENKENILILIGSIIYHTDIEFQLKDMWYERGKDYEWGISFNGDSKCPPLWRHTEWKDASENIADCMEGEKSRRYYMVAAKMIDFAIYDNVIDLGSMNERVREFLPSHVNYIPCDYVKYSEHTVLFDLRKREFPTSLPMDTSKNVILSMGHISLCDDWHWYLDKVCESCDCFILSKQDFARITREYRKTSWNNAHCAFNHEYIVYMLQKGFMLTDACDMGLRREIFKFERTVR
jgi:hypothetical protein